MPEWTTVPPWLYRSPLPDDELQERYLREAERHYRVVVEDRLALEQEVAELRATKRGRRTAEEWSALADELGERTDWLEESYRVEARAKQFLEQARAALAHYKRRRRGP